MLLISNILYKKNASACSLGELDEKTNHAKKIKRLEILKNLQGKGLFFNTIWLLVYIH